MLGSDDENKLEIEAISEDDSEQPVRFLLTDGIDKLESIPTYFSALKHLTIESLPNVTYRLALSGNGVFDAIVLKLTGNNLAVASMPLLTAITQFVLYTGYNILGAGNLLVSEKKTLGEDRAVGKVLQHAWLLSGFLSIPITVIMLNTKPVLIFFDIDEEVADCVNTYYQIVAWANIPLLFLTSTHQFFLGLQRSEVVFGSGILYIVFNVTLGYPLALGKLGLPALGLEGMAWGVFASSCITSVVTQIYLWRSQESKQYHVFAFERGGIFAGIGEILSKGIPLGLQGLSESFNVLLVSIVIGAIGTEALLAMQVPFQMSALLNGMFVAISQTAGITVKEAVTLTKTCLQQPAKNAALYAWQLGIMSMTASFTSAAVVASFYGIMPARLASAFIDFSELDAISDGITQDDVMTLLYPMLWSGAFDLMLTAVRLTIAGTLSGHGVVTFPVISSAVAMTGIAGSIGVVLTLFLKKSPNWLFITRDIGMLAAVTANFLCWKREDRLLNEAIEYDSKPEELYDLVDLAADGSEEDDEQSQRAIPTLHFLTQTEVFDGYSEDDLIDEIALPIEARYFCSIL